MGVRWDHPIGLISTLFLLALACLIEFFLVTGFVFAGLSNESTFTAAFQIPFTRISFVIAISPLFHFIPIGVISVLITSWIHLSKQFATIPRRRQMVRKPLKTVKRSYPKMKHVYITYLNKKSRRLGQVLKSLSHQLSVAILRVRGVSFFLQVLIPVKRTIKSLMTVLTVFSVSFAVLYILGNPNSVQYAISRFYEVNPSFHDFILKTIGTSRGVSQSFSPIGWLASAINEPLNNTALSFRNSLERLTAPVFDPIVSLDIVWKYVFYQCAAAFIAAFTILIYGKLVSGQHHHRI